MNLDEVMEIWRSQDLSPLHGVGNTLLHQMLRQEQAKSEKRRRRMMWVAYAGSALLLGMTGLFLAIMFEAQYNDVRIVWDYVVGVAGLAAAIVVAWTLLALRRSRLARERAFGDSLRDDLRRRIASLDYDATRGRRLALITAAAGLIDMWAIPIVEKRIAHVPVPYDQFYWSPLPIVLIFAFIYLSSMWGWRYGRERRKYLARKRELEALLKELDGQ
jgi:MFS family permease